MLTRNDILRQVAAGDLSVDEADEALAALDRSETADRSLPLGSRIPPLPSRPDRPDRPPRPDRPDQRSRRSPVDELVSFAVHGIDAEYVRELRAAGLRRLSTDDVIALSVHGVDGAYVRKFVEAGFDDLTAAQLVTCAIHGVDPDAAEELLGAFEEE